MKASSEKIPPELKQYIPEFIQDRIQECCSIKEGLSRGDLECVRRMAHKWKGFCTPYGFSYLENLSIELEKSSKNGNFEKAFDLIEEIHEYLAYKKMKL